jgi:hypothetical protein
MNKLIFSLTALAAMAAAAPSLADHRRHDADRYHSAHRSTVGWVRAVEARADALAHAVQDARYSGHIDTSLANSILGKIRSNVSTAHGYRRDGLTEHEVRATEERFRTQEQRLRTGRYYVGRHRYGYGW